LSVVQGGDSSFKVVTNIANTMIGSSVVVYPIMFIKDGIVGALLVLLAIGAALYATCRLLLIHNRPDEPEFGDSIKRILGKKWALLNSAVNFTLIFMVSIAYFMLICSNFFDISSAILHEINEDYIPPSSGEITLKTYSTQYASLLSLLFVGPFLWKKDIEVLMKFFKYTIYFVFLYGIFVLVAFIRSATDGSLDFDLY
jgi:solute carrier family 38 (sodium-coupled neutral amino acid transporter), member 9